MVPLFLWVSVVLGAPDGGIASSATEDPVAATRFIHGSPEHGVPGPFALSGYRIGADAMKRLGLTRAQAFRLRVTHRSLQEVRYTCMADGLMAATGVSPGKMNLALEKVAHEGEMETIVTEPRSHRMLVYRLKATFRDRIRSVDYADFPRAARELESLRDDAVFTVEEKRAP